MPIEKRSKPEKLKPLKGIWNIQGGSDGKVGKTNYKIKWWVSIENNGLKNQLTSEKISMIVNNAIFAVFDDDNLGVSRYKNKAHILSNIGRFNFDVKNIVSDSIENKFGSKITVKDFGISSIELN